MLHRGLTPWVFEADGLARALCEQAELVEALGFGSRFLRERDFAGIGSIPSTPIRHEPGVAATPIKASRAGRFADVGNGMRWFLLVLLVAPSCLAVSGASALTIDVVGANGAVGVDGDAAMASATGADASNSASAHAGTGGSGTALVAPGDGGSADATASVAVIGVATAQADAKGGDGGAADAADHSGTGGGAIASASAEGSLSALALALARGGRGGVGGSGVTGGDGGDAEASAVARTSGDGHDVRVGDPSPTNALTGAYGGWPAFYGELSSGGSAVSESTGEALGDSSVQVFDRAIGSDGAGGGAGGSATSSAIARNAGSEAVEVVAEARGGNGGDPIGFPNIARGGNGGEARLGMVYGRSLTGDVRVIGSLSGGSGGDGVPDSIQSSGDGASVVLDNAVDGDTSGSLYLEQSITGGRGGEHGNGAHGEASSRLAISKHAAALEIVSNAHGGHDATSQASAMNTGGSAVARSFALGGDGRVDFDGVTEDGGDAHARAFASSTGDGHEVVVARESYGGLNAWGGTGAPVGSLGVVPIGGRGGDADSVSEGIAFGDSAVTVVDAVEAGAGGFGNGAGSTPGQGGAARSTAIGVGAGTSSVLAFATAAGGRGGAFEPYSFFVPTGPSARGGDATALSTATGLGEVRSHATARLGSVGSQFLGVVGNVSGAARAHAMATGASGEAGADATAAGFELAALRASTTASVHAQATVEARAAVGDPFEKADLGVIDAFVIATGRPGEAAVLDAIAGTSQVAGAFTGAALDIVLSVGQVGFTNLQDTNGSPAMQHAELTIAPNVFEVSVLQDVTVGFMNPVSLGSGFDTLRFRANLRGETLVDVTFADVSAAFAYFDDDVLDLGGFEFSGVPPYYFPTPPLELLFDWTGSETGSGFGIDLIVGLTPVPEPSTALLLVIGLAMLAARTRQRSGAAV